MSFDESDDNDGEWEVVDIVHTTTSVKTDKKSKPAKREDVEKLAADIQAQLSLKTTQDTQQILLLEQKMKQQQQMSEHQLSTIQAKLNQLTQIQRQQEQQQRDLDKQRRDLEQRQKQQLLEQQIAIQSLSDNQMLTQKQLIEAHQQLQLTHNTAKSAHDNIESLQALQQQQALQQHLTEQQTIDLQQQLQQQQQMSQLAQIAAAQQLNQQTNHLLNTIQQPIPPSAFNLPPPPQNQQTNTNNNNSNNKNSNKHGNMSNHKHNHSNNSNNHGSESNNGWLPNLPSFFAFGANQNKKQNNNNSSNNKNGQQMNMNMNMNGNMQSNTNIQDMDMDMAASPPLQPLATLSAMNQFHAAEEKSNVLMEDDDEDVLRWQNDYGTQSVNVNVNPLYQNPALLKTKGVIGEGKFTPNEKRQCGWILQNKSNALLKLSARLEAMGGDQEQYGMKIATEKVYEFSLKPNEEVYILIEVEAPGVVGKYCAFYQLVIENGVKVGEVLEVVCEVEAQFSAKREEKIAQIVKMGFSDRKQVIATLQKYKWNVQQSVDKLIGL